MNEVRRWTRGIPTVWLAQGSSKVPTMAHSSPQIFQTAQAAVLTWKARAAEAPARPPPPDLGRASVTAGNCCPLLSHETGQVSLVWQNQVYCYIEIKSPMIRTSSSQGSQDFRWVHPDPSILALHIYRTPGPSCSTAREASCKPNSA